MLKIKHCIKGQQNPRLHLNNFNQTYAIFQIILLIIILGIHNVFHSVCVQNRYYYI